ncbi:MAG TPA: hypothetical protein VFU55_07140 [Terracidiphilus sp.]|nr:hypothetical protein [Terracidiphilus sp.]
MNTDYAIGHIRIRFESQARRRRFVALVYAVLALFDLAMSYLHSKEIAGAWTIGLVLALVVLFGVLWIIFSQISGDMRARGDERETHRRDHAHYVAYYALLYLLIAELVMGNYRGPNPISPHLPVVLHAFLAQSPYFLFLATLFLYLTLPQAILLWTEPDMEMLEKSR